MSELIGGRYRVDALLGSGAFATVHLAHDEQLDDPVAVKILAHNHAVNPDIRSRFILEGQTLRRLSSPHLVSVHDLSTTEDGRPFLVLEWCDRGTLRDRAEQARTSGWTPTEADAVTIATALADAIGTLADAAVVHRDLTPANVLLTSRGKPLPAGDPSSTLIAADERLVVTDLGFCKDLAASSGISAAGGTAGFQPPEQSLIGGVVDLRSDLWAASAMLTWVLCGTTATTPADAVAGITAAGLSQPVAAAISNGLHHDPSRRPPRPWHGWTASPRPPPKRLRHHRLWGTIQSAARHRIGGLAPGPGQCWPSWRSWPACLSYRCWHTVWAAGSATHSPEKRCRWPPATPGPAQPERNGATSTPEHRPP